MLGDTILTTLPSALECLSWSSDCELAISAHDFIELMIPRLSTPGPSPTNYEILHLRANLFTAAEVDIEEPAAFALFSPGEELSVGNIASLAWSGPGLARHARSALAVHTERLVLALYAAEGRPTEVGGWKRVLVVNRVLERFFEGVYPGLPRDENGDRAPLIKRAQRVRSFAWSPCVPARWAEECGVASAVQFLAVGNDAAEVVVLQVRSPCNSAEREWGAGIVARIPLGQGGKLPDLGWVFGEYVREQRWAGWVAWSPWEVVEGGVVSVLAYGTVERVYFRRVGLMLDPLKSKIEIGEVEEGGVLPLGVTFNGPVRWVPVGLGGQMVLVATSPGAVHCFAVGTDGPLEVKETRYAREVWDEVGGYAFEHTSDTSIDLFFPPFRLSTKADLISLSLPSAKPTPFDPPWIDSITRSLASFSEEHDLYGHAEAKAWGFGASPLGDFMALCYSLHPTHMPEYKIPAEYRCTVAVTRARRGPAEDFALPSEGNFVGAEVSAEALAFSIRAWVDEQPEAPEDSASVIRDIVQEISTALHLPSSYAPPPLSSPTLSLRHALFTSPTITRLRLERLISLYFPWYTPATDTNTSLIRTLAVATHRIPHTTYRASLISTKILEAYSMAVSKTRALSAQEVEDIDMLPAHEFERCEICGCPIHFEGFDEGRCEGGHEFVRCALTFLAIQAPGISRFCGLCERQFLTDAYLQGDVYEDSGAGSDPATVNDNPSVSASSSTNGAAPETEKEDDGSDPMPLDTPARTEIDMDEDSDPITESTEPTAEPAPLDPIIVLPTTGAANRSLAQILLQACDRCPYCGGKFVG
ncbi:hypothetical protein EJ06DRAFT_580839 [Trichodelitschia bisporula]|uniref:Transcription factor IIIC putative zinc-finger domain-containing protein n=1 Tax=Trichodelitschia bisporula TaxID=703511 RepID=A0A6G1I3C4_9PEZI|nr:hypothetical protein EJ06DRAFT_580839 [Trichodelitschia bisporula]